MRRNYLDILGIGGAGGTIGILALLVIVLLYMSEPGFAVIVLFLIAVFVIVGAIALVARSAK